MLHSLELNTFLRSNIDPVGTLPLLLLVMPKFDNAMGSVSIPLYPADISKSCLIHRSGYFIVDHCGPARLAAFVSANRLTNCCLLLAFVIISLVV